MRLSWTSIIFGLLFIGCASDRVYVDTEKVSGLGVEVHFPSGRILPIETERVVSGNTIELTNQEVVLYIGVYIPELYNIPEAAKGLNERLVLNNQIRLEFDKRQRDSRGRLLAYVYTLDGVLINAKIIREGLAKALIKPPNDRYKDLLLQAEEEARRRRQGIWSEEFKK